MEIHTPVSNFQKSKVAWPAFPAWIMAGERLTDGLGEKKEIPMFFWTRLGQGESQASGRLQPKALFRGSPGKERTGGVDVGYMGSSGDRRRLSEARNEGKAPSGAFPSS